VGSMWGLALLQQQPQGSPWGAFLPLLLILVIFYVLLILPAQRQRRRQQQMLSALKTGDRVITTGGILGTIVGIKDNIVTLRIADQVRIEVLRQAIATLQPSSPDAESGS
jgi:preprotein translocase subunit YajC